MAVRLIGRVIVNAAIENLRDGAISIPRFISSSAMNLARERLRLSLMASLPVALSAAPMYLNFQAIFLGDACYFVEIDEL